MALGEATGEGAASVVVEGPGLHAEKLRLGTMNRAFKRFLVKVQLSQYLGDACQSCGTTTRTAQTLEWIQTDPRRQAVCVA